MSDFRNATGLATWAALLLLATLAIDLAASMKKGWIPHDEGTLGQAAERVMDGELPHLDFDDPYTGALAMLHATSFRLLGAKSSTTRIVLWLFSTLFLAAFYWLVRSRVGPVAAAGVTLVAVAWSFGNYFAGLPSWYNLFFSVFGLAAWLRFLEARGLRRFRWALLAGALAGISLLFKITGGFFIAASCLFLLYDAILKAPRVDRRPTLCPSTILVWAAPVLTGVCLLTLLRSRLAPMEVIHFLLPGLGLSLLPAWELHRRGVAIDRQGWRRLLADAGGFTAGILAPLSAFLLFYGLVGGLGAFERLFYGVFVLPQQRLERVALELPGLSSLAPALPLLLLFLPPVQRRLNRPIVLILVAAVLLLAALRGSTAAVYDAVWTSARFLVPLLCGLAVVYLLDGRQSRQPSSPAKARLYLLATTAALMSLLQFPYAYGVYFFYLAPLVVLLTLEIFRIGATATGRVQVVLGGFLLLFALLWLRNADERNYGLHYQPREALATLLPDRVDLDVPLLHHRGYQAVVELVERLAPEDRFIWAGPDCPEIYFLTRKQNPTRSFFELFSRMTVGEFFDMLHSRSIRLIVINRHPEFSPPLPPPVTARLAQLYPGKVDVGPVTIRWIPPPPEAGSAGVSPASGD